MAVVAAVRHFKYYRGGLPFVVRTDHSALQWLLRFKEPEGEIASWLEELQPYDFQITELAVDTVMTTPCLVTRVLKTAMGTMLNGSSGNGSCARRSYCHGEPAGGGRVLGP